MLVQWCKKPIRFPLIESPQGAAGPLFEPDRQRNLKGNWYLGGAATTHLAPLIFERRDEGWTEAGSRMQGVR